MFESSLVESNHVIQGRSRLSVWLSVAIQVAVAAVLVTVPLMQPETIGHIAFTPPQIFAPLPQPPPPPPVHLLVHASSATEAPAAAAPQATRLMTATLDSNPRLLVREQPNGEGPPSITALGPFVMGPAGSSGINPFGTAPNGPAVAVAGPPRPIRVSAGVTAGMLLAPILPQ